MTIEPVHINSNRANKKETIYLLLLPAVIFFLVLVISYNILKAEKYQAITSIISTSILGIFTESK